MAAFVARSGLCKLRFDFQLLDSFVVLLVVSVQTVKFNRAACRSEQRVLHGLSITETPPILVIRCANGAAANGGEEVLVQRIIQQKVKGPAPCDVGPRSVQICFVCK